MCAHMTTLHSLALQNQLIVVIYVIRLLRITDTIEMELVLVM